MEAFFWPKIFWDFLTKNLDSAVKPFPILQIINIILGVVGLAYEYPLPLLAGTGLHRSIEARLILYPLSALCALLIYQGTNSGLYYIIGMIAYFWAYSEGEVSQTLSSRKLTNTILTIYADCMSRTMDITQARLDSAENDSLSGPHPISCYTASPSFSYYP